MKRVCLIVLDGWGLNPGRKGNAIAAAATPNMDGYAKVYPATVLDTSGLSVGLPPGQMGNSEVGHLTMGAGRIVYQDLERINKSIDDGEFGKNPGLINILEKLKKGGGALHLTGLLSDGGVHSHMRHLYSLIDAAKGRGIKKVFVHAFMDGRDTPPTGGTGYMKELLAYMDKTGCGKVATVSGRYYAMDRDNRWERVEKAYRAMVDGAGQEAADALSAVTSSYEGGKTDEFIVPTVIEDGGRPVATVEDGDGVIFFNFRADRARELTRAFTSDGFNGFERKKLKLAEFLCMTEYDASFDLPVLFKPQALTNILGEVLSKRGLKQFRTSETEKYAHVTFFFNGGREEPFPGEDRLLVPSVKDVPTYDKAPAMRAKEIADAAVEKISSGQYSFMLMNFANGDMVGHTGVMQAAIEACAAVDAGVGRVVSAALGEGWAVIITSDHGNAEQMIDPATGGPFTAHTTNLVPFILIDGGHGLKLHDKGGLQDVAPTVLKLMDIDKPAEMNGKALF